MKVKEIRKERLIFRPNRKRTSIKELLKANTTLIMGVLNVTPDSFSDGGKFFKLDQAVKQAKKMVREGADIIDIGGESTRPYAAKVGEEEEKKRVIPLIKTLVQEIDVLLSVDTTSSEVAKQALAAGATIVNDISALNFDKRMAEIVADFQAEVILMHIKGNPQNMQDNPFYKEVIGEIMDYFKGRLAFAERAGIAPDRIILDPGIGFGKTTEDNLKIINNLDKFKELKKPVLIGTSRKSFIGKVLAIKDPLARVFGTAASVVMSIMKGARIIRVHDVKEMRELARMTEAIIRS